MMLTVVVVVVSVIIVIMSYLARFIEILVMSSFEKMNDLEMGNRNNECVEDDHVETRQVKSLEEKELDIIKHDMEVTDSVLREICDEVDKEDQEISIIEHDLESIDNSLIEIFDDVEKEDQEINIIEHDLESINNSLIEIFDDIEKEDLEINIEIDLESIDISLKEIYDDLEKEDLEINMQKVEKCKEKTEISLNNNRKKVMEGENKNDQNLEKSEIEDLSSVKIVTAEIKSIENGKMQKNEFTLKKKKKFLKRRISHLFRKVQKKKKKGNNSRRKKRVEDFLKKIRKIF